MEILDIKRVDDRKMEIHKKEKAKVHVKDKSKLWDKKSSIHTREKTPDIVKTGLSATRRKITGHVEGGEEIDNAMLVGNSAVNVTGKTVHSAKEIAEIAKRIKRVNQGKGLARKKAIRQSRKTAKQVPKTMVKKTGKEGTKIVAKETAKIATEAAVTAAGTATTGPAGPLIGMAAGEIAGIKMDMADARHTNRLRKIKFFRDKLQSQEQQTDNLFKLVKDLFAKKFSVVAKYFVKYMVIFLLLIIILVAIVAVPVMAVIAILYNSPLAIFLPPLESGDTVQSVASAYMADFNRQITDLSTQHKDHDKGQIVYVNYEGTGTPDNLYDIVCVYMVKYGYENIAIKR